VIPVVGGSNPLVHPNYIKRLVVFPVVRRRHCGRICTRGWRNGWEPDRTRVVQQIDRSQVRVGAHRVFWRKHAEAEQPLRAWVKAVGAAEWKRPSDIAAQFTTASVFKSRRVVFNIKGNEYRLVVAVAYRFGAVY
jgi:mRNA interferase HigB